MDNIIKQLKRGAKHTRLTVEEKATMKNALLCHIKENPVRSEAFARQQFVKGNRSILSPFQINNLRNRKTMPILVILGLLMGGSASFAAENTVPGDVLYPVKVHFNESVRGAVAVTPKAKAEWEVRLAERRLEEVEKLAVTPSALPEVRQIAQANLAEYTDRVKEHIAKFEEENDSEDAILTAGELASMLRTHEGVLAGLNTQVSGAVATSTATTMATTTAGVATSTALAADTSMADARSLASIIAQLRADRGEAEQRHKELEHKYHPEIKKIEEDKNDQMSDEGEEAMPNRWMPSPIMSAPVSTTTNATPATSTATIQTAVPGASSWKHGDTSSRKEYHEEIHAIEETVPVASITAPAITVPTATTEHTESHFETQKVPESSKSKDSD